MLSATLAKLPVLLAVCIGLGPAASGSAADEEFKPDGRLVGSWEVSWARTSGDKHHRLAQVEALDFSSSGELVYMENWRYGGGSYTVRPAATPRDIDLTINAIGAKLARGIYRFHGENLILCVSAEGADRPTDFDLPPGSDRALLVLQRSQVKHRSKDEAARLLAQFKAHADQCEVTIARHGNAKIDLRSITLHSSNRRFEPSAVGPAGQPVFKSARITKEQALQVIDVLEGWPAFFFRTAQDSAEPLRERPPFFVTQLGYGADAKQGPQLHLALDWGWHAIFYFAAIHKCVDGDAAKLVGEIQKAIENDRAARRDTAPAKSKPPETVKVLLVNGKPAADRFDTATEYLRLALHPVGERDSDKFDPRIVSVAQFDDPGFQRSLHDWHCIFLCDVPSLSPAQTKALEQYVQPGGGLVVCLGPRVDLPAYNTNFYRQGKGLLPVKLLGQRDANKDHVFRFAVTDESFQHPPLAAFHAQADRLALFASKSQSFVRIDEPAPGVKARVIATYAETPLAKGGKPSRAGIAMLEWRPFGSAAENTGGRVVLLTSTVNMDWTSWPGSPSFGALAHELVRRVVANRPSPRTGYPPHD